MTMLASLIAPFRLIGKTPSILFVPIITALIIGGILWISLDTITDLLVNVLFLDEGLNTGLFEGPWHLYVAYGGHFNILALVGLIISVLFVWNGIYFAAFARDVDRGDGSAMGAARVANSRIRQSVSVALFFALLAFVFFVGLWWLVHFLIPWGLVGVGLVLIFLLTSYIVYISLVFTVPIIGIDETTLSKALAKSSQFARKRMWNVFIFALLAAFVNSIIFQAGDTLASITGDDVLYLIVFAIFWAIALAYQSLAFASYYLNRSGT
jgi:hypothetical protein